MTLCRAGAEVAVISGTGREGECECRARQSLEQLSMEAGLGLFCARETREREAALNIKNIQWSWDVMERAQGFYVQHPVLSRDPAAAAVFPEPFLASLKRTSSHVK